jgi:hypothetical protein
VGSTVLWRAFDTTTCISALGLCNASRIVNLLQFVAALERVPAGSYACEEYTTRFEIFSLTGNFPKAVKSVEYLNRTLVCIKISNLSPATR